MRGNGGAQLRSGHSDDARPIACGTARTWLEAGYLTSVGMTRHDYGTMRQALKEGREVRIRPATESELATAQGVLDGINSMTG